METKRKLERGEDQENNDGNMGWEHDVDELSMLGGSRRGRKGYVGVRQRASGRWVAEIKDTIQKIRLWLGTFDTAEEAARAYDEAACLLRGTNTRTNFWHDPIASKMNQKALSSKITKLLVNRLKARGHENSSFLGNDQSDNHEIDEMESPQFEVFTEIPSNNSEYYLNDVDRFMSNEKELSKERKCQREGEEDKEVEVIDFKFVDSVESSNSYYSPFEIAEEMVQPIHDQENSEDLCMFTQAMKRMKYERKFSASLYAFNGVSECLNLKVKSQNDEKNGKSECLSKLISDFSDDLKTKREDGCDNIDIQELDARQESSKETGSSCSQSASSCSSSNSKEVEWSLWNSLDLPLSPFYLFDERDCRPSSYHTDGRSG